MQGACAAVCYLQHAQDERRRRKETPLHSDDVHVRTGSALPNSMPAYFVGGQFAAGYFAVGYFADVDTQHLLLPDLLQLL